jgi:GAF domain-containing protein
LDFGHSENVVKPPRPTNEQERLAALASYAILDTGAESEFDDLVAIASHVCDAPFATVTLIDEDRQWHKARIGVPVQETPRDVALCAHTILGDETVVVRDLREDDRFCDNPFVMGEPGVRFYAGAPLLTRDGYVLGTLCVMDTSVRSDSPLTPAQLSCFEALTRQAVRLIENRRTSRMLVDALDRARLLDPLVPICAWCKRVRDDEDYWSSISEYLKEHAGVATTHGLCPDCFDRMDQPASPVSGGPPAPGMS